MSSSTAPARIILEQAEQQNRALGHENLGFLSAQYGFMPQHPPLLALPKSHALWDEWALQLPELYKRVSIRRILDTLPMLSAAEEALADPYLHRANTVLGILAQAYSYAQFGQVEQIPPALMQPLTEIAKRLKRPRAGLNLNDLTIGNWKLKDPNQPERTLDNLDLLVDVFAVPEDRLFNLSIVELYYVAAPLISSVVRAQEAMLREDDNAIQAELFIMIDVLRKMVETFQKVQMETYSNYRLHPMVWAKTSGTFSLSLQAHSAGLSGGAVSFVHVLDAFLGRKFYDSRLGVLEKRLIYLSDPPHIKSFLEAVEKMPLGAYLEKRNNKELSGSFMHFLELYTGEQGFLGVHRRKVFGFLETAMKVGVTTTPGGLSATEAFSHRAWHKIYRFLKEAGEERIRSYHPVYPWVTRVLAESAFIEEQPFLLDFDLNGTGILLEPRNQLQILVFNDDAKVKKLIELFELDPEQEIKLTSQWQAWLKRFHLEQTQTDRIKLSFFLRVAHFSPTSKRMLENLFRLTRFPALQALLRETNHSPIKWDFYQLLKNIKENFGYNIKRFIYAEAWRDDNMSKWVLPIDFVSYPVFRKSEEGPHHRVSTLILPLKKQVLENSADSFKVQATRLLIDPHSLNRKFYAQLQPETQFKLPEVGIPLVLFAEDNGLNAFRGLLEEILIENRQRKIILYYSIRDIAAESIHALFKCWKSRLNLNVFILDLEVPESVFFDLKYSREQTVLWQKLRTKLDQGEEAALYLCGSKKFVNTIRQSLYQFVLKQYKSEEKSTGAEQFISVMKGENRYEFSVLPETDLTSELPVVWDISEVTLHNNDIQGYWMIINQRVYDITRLLHLHEGGALILRHQSGLDATEEYQEIEHHKDEKIQNKLAAYEIGHVRIIDFEFRWGIAPVAGQYQFILFKDFWMLWTKKVFLLVEMENAVNTLFSYYDCVVRYWNEPCEKLMAYQLQATADGHNTFIRYYLQEAFNHIVELWAVTASMCSIQTDLFFLREQYEIIQFSEAYEKNSALVLLCQDKIEKIHKSDLSLSEAYRSYQPLLKELIHSDKVLITDLKESLRSGLKVFETFGKEVVDKGESKLLGSLTAILPVVRQYFERNEKIHNRLLIL